MQLCRDLYPRLVGALGLFGGDHAAAEDFAQEALARLWPRWPTGRRPDQPVAWCDPVTGIRLFLDATPLTDEEIRRIGVEVLSEGPILRRVRAGQPF